ncbi:GtrA family protein [Lachnospiraceae bacterium 66-29]
MEKKRLIIQIFRFGIVGGTAFLLDYSILYCLTEFVDINYLLSGMMSFSISVIYNYVLSKTWVFKTKKNNRKMTEFIIFIILSVVGLGINQIIMCIGVEFFNVYYMFVKVFSTCIVMIYNFITRKLFLE